MSGIFDYDGIAFTPGDDKFSSAQSAAQLASLAQTGANAVSIIGTGYQSSASASTITTTSNTTSLANLAKMIDHAHALGLKVTLTPQLNLPGGEFRGDIHPTDITDWFKSYESFILDYAKLAQAHGVEMLSLGTEMNGVVNAQTTPYWDQLIDDVRSVYKGQVTYQALEYNVNDVHFWDKLDVISVQGYVPVADSTTVTVDSAVAAWNSVPSDLFRASVFNHMSPVEFFKSIAFEYNKPFMFSELGYRDVDSAGEDPGAWQGGNVDAVEQKALYQAFFRVFGGETSWFSGVNLWQWSSTADTAEGTYNLATAPALTEIEQWYSGANNVLASATKVGTASNDTLSGGSGGDLLIGGDGDDALHGGIGDDILVGDGGLARANSTLVVYARGSAAGGIDPLMKVSVNGVVLGTVDVASSANFTAYSFSIAPGLLIKSVMIAYTNDAVINGEDRNLYIQQTTVNGTTLDASLATNSAYPGKFALYSEGSLSYNLTSRPDISGGSVSGNDTLDGGAGDDTASYSYATAGVAVDLRIQGKAQDTVGAGHDTLISIENLTGSAFADTLTGNANNNVLNGNGGGDTLDGGGGNDLLIGGAGHDTFIVTANSGSDIIQNFTPGQDVIHLNGYGLSTFANVLAVATQAGSDVELSFANGATLILCAITLANLVAADFGVVDNVQRTSVSTTLGADMPNLIYTGTAGATLTGNALANAITSGPGNDVINGGGGADVMTGGLGNDTYYVDNSGDMIVEVANAGTDLVHSTISYTLPFSVEHLALDGSADINATGNALNNAIVGNGGNNVLNGMGGADVMKGGLGNDTYYVDNAGDQVIEAANGGTDNVHSTISYGLPANVENLVLDGVTNINASGNTLDNIITGNSGNNQIYGGAGADILTGGGGSDTFIYLATSESTLAATDFITDFISGSDKIDLSSLHLTSLAGLTISSSNSSTYVDVDIDNDGVADMAIMFAGARSIALGDIVTGISTPNASSHVGETDIAHADFVATFHTAMTDYV